MTTKIHPSEDPMQLADTAIGRALLNPIDRTIQALAQPQSPATAQEAVVMLQHIINRSEGQPDVIYTCAMAIADIATEACEKGMIVDPLAGSDFESPTPHCNCSPLPSCSQHPVGVTCHACRPRNAAQAIIAARNEELAADRAATVPTEWAPLINLIGEAQLGNFMYMGSVGDIQLYKHIRTRRYVNVDDKGQTYQHTAGVVPSGYEPIPQDQALRYVLS